MALTVGSPAPDFHLADQEGTMHSLSECKGKWTLLYFYPKDSTPGCTVEAQTIRDAWPDFTGMNITVFGISADSVASHKKFADNHGLPFTLLADEQKEMVQAYGVWGKKKMMGREYDGIFRTSFLIAPDGTIAHIYENVKPSEHAAQVLADVKAHS